ncbi:MAG TPA: alpha/beta fold hydrolase [Longimicrobiales bacterium]|nr:alpha/beta fold hydrolase [Longimicrobiales bacterium]
MDQLLAAGGAPSDVRSVWTQQLGGRTHHIEAGSGEPVVLLHGGTGGGANWFRVIGPLASRFRVLAPDLPGFGLSDPIPVTRPLGTAAADRLVDWMAQNDVTDALMVGTSFGGLAALRIAQRSSRVTRLLLLDAAGLGRAIHPAVRLATSLPLTRLLMAPSRRGTAVVLRLLLTTDRSLMSTTQERALIEYLLTTARAAGTAYLARTLAMFAGAGGQREVLGPDELARLRLPVSIVWGERDRLLPLAGVRQAAQALPDARLIVIPGTGHSPNWERPEAVVAAVVDLSSR